jgi:cell fate regulator YaaT (PSP1 superfamily)
MNIALVEFSRAGQLYPFFYKDEELTIKDKVVAEYERGVSIGTVMKLQTMDYISDDLHFILRKATKEDLQIHQENKQLAKEAFEKCKEEITYHGLNMKLVKVDYMLDRSKIVFYFVAPGRVDFRNLVKKLASMFKTRIEMRQIGVRDEARIVGGLGLCGDELCCSRFLRTFNPVSVKMAKDQNLNINVKKISGACGRLMCCLWYEHGLYEEFMDIAPPMDSIAKAGDVEGKVVYINPIKKTVILRQKDGLMIETDVEDIEEIIDEGDRNG